MSSRRDIDELQRTSANHFRLHVYAAVAALRARLPEPDERNGLGFLTGYYEQLDLAGAADWSPRIERWEAAAESHLPLRALRLAHALSPLAMTLLVTAGLADEDARFGPLFEALNGMPGETRPTLGVLATWSEGDEARDALATLLDAGLLGTGNADGARQRWALQVPGVLWDALRGRSPAGHVAAEDAPRLEELRLAPEVAAALARVPQLLAAEPGQAVVVRGPRSSGRHAAVAAVARALGRGTLQLDTGPVGPLAVALNALPVIEVEPAPGETVELPRVPGYPGPLAVVLGRSGAVRADRAIVVQLGVPDVALRRALWRDALADDELADELAPALRITSGSIRRLARLARTEAALAGQPAPRLGDVLAALGALDAQELETLATRVRVAGGWDDLALAPDTARELELIEHRCRMREQLHESVGAALSTQLTPGVRALFSGPTGTGKTLAVRALASVLGKELFAVDLSMVVNKYLGETEKNLDAVFSRAEELDVVLLLDEGDALMTRRTDVQTSNDRYANLETNFLLQRLESYEGILVVTTNAGERIDAAFRRRLDVVVEFRAPEATERWSIWQLHLPPTHLVDDAFLDEVAARCQLSGGQIRNAVLHASLLALEDGSAVEARHVEVAVRREYRKTGGVCPLRAAAVVHG